MKELDKERQQAILKILNFIQDGGELEEAKKMFQAAFDQVDVAEITAAERELIAQGLDQEKFNIYAMFMPMFLRVILRKIRRILSLKNQVILFIHSS